jgi:RIO kinase 3
VSGKGDEMITKHDILLNSRHNATKFMSFPPEFDTGDSKGFDMRLPNKVYNQLKIHSLKKFGRIQDKQDKSTNVIALDPKTRLILFKLVNADILGSVGGVVSTGKEATVFYATGGETKEVLVPKECVIKAFKTRLNEFKTREKYIGDDYRFKDRFKHLNTVKIIRLWAEKEMHNLMKMRRYEIPCPEVVILKKHVLVMSFIGKDSQPAPKLSEAKLNQSQLKSAYEQCIQIIKDLYTKCNLVHADFNQFNLLWFQDRVWVIDVAQSVEPIHPMGLEFLLRDCTNIHKFFTNRKLEEVEVKIGEELFNEVTGMNFDGEGELFLSQIQRYIKDKRAEMNLAENKMEENDVYNFDYYFNRSLEKNMRKAQDNEDKEVEDEEEEDSDDNWEEIDYEGEDKE